MMAPDTALRRIYLDHAATSPIRPAALAAMASCWSSALANPASAHAEGRLARRMVDEARDRVAALVGARPEEVVFTSGATEAANLAVRGAAMARRDGGRRLATSDVEHAATRRAMEALAVAGWQVRSLAVDADGRVTPDAMRRPFEPGTAVVAVIAGQNELGTLQPLHALAEAAHRVGALLYVDAVQAAGYVDLSDVPWDLLALSAHKLGGPPGVGALVRRGQVAVAPMLVGGEQEGGIRPGTVPTALVAGFGAVCEVVGASRAFEARLIAARRDRLGAALLAGVPALRPVGAWSRTLPLDPGAAASFAASLALALPHIAAFLLPDAAGDEIVHALDVAGIAAASASACLSGTRSPTLDAIGAPAGAGLLRLSLGWTTDDAAIEVAAERLAVALTAFTAMSPFERRRGLIAARAEASGLVLGAAHWEAAEAIHAYWLAEGVLPGPRWLARLQRGGEPLEALFPAGLVTLAAWLGLPVPRGGCGSMRV